MQHCLNGWRLVWVLVSIPFFFSCTTKPIDLKFNPALGDRYTYLFEYDMQQQFMGQPVNTTLKAAFFMEVTGQEGAEKIIQARYDRFALNLQSPSGSIAADTDQPAPDAEAIKADPSKMISRLYHAIKGQSFTIRINTRGEVTAVKGFDTIIDRITTAVMTDLVLPEAQREVIKSTAGGQFNETVIRDMMQQTFYIYPGNPAKAGDQWTTRLTVQQGFPLSVATTYTLQSISGKEIRLDTRSTLEGDLQPGSMLGGEQTGVLVVDAATGMLLSAVTQQRLKGIINGGDMNMTTKGTVTGKKL